jgi:hypothetical protein
VRELYDVAVALYNRENHHESRQDNSREDENYISCHARVHQHAAVVFENRKRNKHNQGDRHDPHQSGQAVLVEICEIYSKKVFVCRV